MADKSNQLVVSALSQAVAHAEGLPLHGGKTAPGLFPSNAAGKQAAQRCLAEGYLHCSSSSAVPAEPAPETGRPKRAKSSAETCTITEKGLAYLFSQVSPRQVLEDLVRVLELRQGQVGQLLDCARQMQAGLCALKSNTEKVLQQLQQHGPGGANGNLARLFRAFLDQQDPPSATAPPAAAACSSSVLVQAVLTQLQRWQKSSRASEDCPLPELFRQVGSGVPGLTIGRFHDVLRQLHDAGQIYLHPWPGPLYDLPEPPQALLVGHEVAYYTSLRPGTGDTPLPKDMDSAVSY